jgi:xanthine dehydrogenase accessory factor
MNTGKPLVLIRGGGDLATGVAYRLHRSGFPQIVLELANPLVVRRRVALATAVLEDQVQIEALRGRLVSNVTEAVELAYSEEIPVLVAPSLPEIQATILIDARVAKRNIDTNIDQAPLVIALGPGFAAGIDCDVVIETKRGHRLGRAIWRGSAQPDTGTPGIIAGMGAERVLRAPVDGRVQWSHEIGDEAASGDVIGLVGAEPVYSPFDGVLRGLIAPGSQVKAGLKIGDVDPRGDVSACFTISDKALSIAGGVLEAILTWQERQR